MKKYIFNKLLRKASVVRESADNESKATLMQQQDAEFKERFLTQFTFFQGI